MTERAAAANAAAAARITAGSCRQQRGLCERGRDRGAATATATCGWGGGGTGRGAQQQKVRQEQPKRRKHCSESVLNATRPRGQPNAGALKYKAKGKWRQLASGPKAKRCPPTPAATPCVAGRGAHGGPPEHRPGAPQPPSAPSSRSTANKKGGWGGSVAGRVLGELDGRGARRCASRARVCSWACGG